MEEFTQILNDFLENASEEKLKRLDSEKIMDVMLNFSEDIKNNLIQNSPQLIEKRRKYVSDFYELNFQRWGKAFDLFEILIATCIEVGEKFIEFYKPHAIEKNEIQFDIVVRHHARACHMAQEILCLLKSGFADGAHARWRALHEVNVIAMFITKHGYETAKRFYDYEIVESYKGMLMHKEYEDRLQEKAPSQSKIDATKVLYDEIKEKYGKEFTKPYGWATHIYLDRKATFDRLEKDVKLEHWRPYYKWASFKTHASPKGIISNLGLSEAEEEILLVGHSDAGMLIPADQAGLSLSQITYTLLSFHSNMDTLIMSKMIKSLQKEVTTTFLECQKETSSSKE